MALIMTNGWILDQRKTNQTTNGLYHKRGYTSDKMLSRIEWGFLLVKCHKKTKNKNWFLVSCQKYRKMNKYLFVLTI
jgi:hypothetical protein